MATAQRRHTLLNLVGLSSKSNEDSQNFHTMMESFTSLETFEIPPDMLDSGDSRNDPKQRSKSLNRRFSNLKKKLSTTPVKKRGICKDLGKVSPPASPKQRQSKSPVPRRGTANTENVSDSESMEDLYDELAGTSSIQNNAMAPEEETNGRRARRRSFIHSFMGSASKAFDAPKGSNNHKAASSAEDKTAHPQQLDKSHSSQLDYNANHKSSAPLQESQGTLNTSISTLNTSHSSLNTSHSSLREGRTRRRARLVSSKAIHESNTIQEAREEQKPSFSPSPSPKSTERRPSRMGRRPVRSASPRHRIKPAADDDTQTKLVKRTSTSLSPTSQRQRVNAPLRGTKTTITASAASDNSSGHNRNSEHSGRTAETEETTASSATVTTGRKQTVGSGHRRRRSVSKTKDADSSGSNGNQASGQDKITEKAMRSSLLGMDEEEFAIDDLLEFADQVEEQAPQRKFEPSTSQPLESKPGHNKPSERAQPPKPQQVNRSQEPGKSKENKPHHNQKLQQDHHHKSKNQPSGPKAPPDKQQQLRQERRRSRSVSPRKMMSNPAGAPGDATAYNYNGNKSSSGLNVESRPIGKSLHNSMSMTQQSNKKTLVDLLEQSPRTVRNCRSVVSSTEYERRTPQGRDKLSMRQDRKSLLLIERGKPGVHRDAARKSPRSPNSSSGDAGNVDTARGRARNRVEQLKSQIQNSQNIGREPIRRSSTRSMRDSRSSSHDGSRTTVKAGNRTSRSPVPSSQRKRQSKSPGPPPPPTKSPGTADRKTVAARSTTPGGPAKPSGKPGTTRSPAVRPSAKSSSTLGKNRPSTPGKSGVQSPGKPTNRKSPGPTPNVPSRPVSGKGQRGSIRKPDTERSQRNEQIIRKALKDGEPQEVQVEEKTNSGAIVKKRLKVIPASNVEGVESAMRNNSGGQRKRSSSIAAQLQIPDIDELEKDSLSVRYTEYNDISFTNHPVLDYDDDDENDD